MRALFRFGAVPTPAAAFVVFFGLAVLLPTGRTVPALVAPVEVLGRVVDDWAGAFAAVRLAALAPLPAEAEALAVRPVDGAFAAGTGVRVEATLPEAVDRAAGALLAGVASEGTEPRVDAFRICCFRRSRGKKGQGL